MNIVNSGSTYQVYGEDLHTFKQLPAASYEVCFHKMKGFFLQSRPNLESKEGKIYGDHERRVAKVLDAFEIANRNLGIILSGEKGIGKSLFARVLAEQAMGKGIPLINVSNYVPGVAAFLSSIEQEVIVLFDEFEKTFAANSEDGDPQVELLPMFDGVDSGKKLFVITCNDYTRLNSCLLNRPGRFHYHFSLVSPNGEEIEEYLSDNLLPEYKHNIPEIVSLSYLANFTYDCLRAIVFEINRGYSVKETFSDLNIARIDRVHYRVIASFEDGTVAESRGAEEFNWLNKGRRSRVMLEKNVDRCWVNIFFSLRDVSIDLGSGLISLDPAKATVSYDFDYYGDNGDSEEDERRKKEISNKKLVSIVFLREEERGKNYLM